MAFVITKHCINDASCVPVCPVNCIHPRPDEPDFATAEMLYIDPAVCIDCGACLPACPVNAIEPDYELSPENVLFPALNAQYFADPAKTGYDSVTYRATPLPFPTVRERKLQVAIVGSGPSGMYAADELLGLRGVELEVHMFEKLPTPLGLIRAGVAPDHQATKDASAVFGRLAQRKNFQIWLNVEVGRDITLDELRSRFDAVILASGASMQRPLGVPGEDLPGSHTAADFVGWYNSHPDHAQHSFDLSHERAVVIGNGNVALDIARILLSPIDELRKSDIADHALKTLTESRVREVVVLGRRGLAQAAFTTSELIGLADTPGIDVVVQADDLELDAVTAASFAETPHSLDLYKMQVAREVTRTASEGDHVAKLRFRVIPEEIVGADHVERLLVRRTELVEGARGVEARPTDDVESIECGLVINATGFRAPALADVPFDERRGVAVNEAGRIQEGLYTTGWLKRGPSGTIGTNRRDARETVTALLNDWNEGHLKHAASTEDLAELLPGRLGLQHWRAIDSSERAAGRQAGRPRVKIAERTKLLEVASQADSPSA
jgi:ferredoxin--NADP+ reductase